MIYRLSNSGVSAPNEGDFPSVEKVNRATVGQIGIPQKAKLSLKTKEFDNLTSLMPLAQVIHANRQHIEKNASKTSQVSSQETMGQLVTSIFCLYYILTKLGIVSEFSSGSSTKEEIVALNEEITAVHQKRQEEVSKALEQEKTANRWDVAAQFFSWLGSLLGVISGIALVAMGVYAVAGCILITAGIIQLTSQICQLTGAWEQIRSILPGNDEHKKQAVINWMQMAIAILALVLAGVGAVFGDFSAVKDAFGGAQYMMGGIAAMGSGITAIGLGITNQKFENSQAKIKEHEYRLNAKKHRHQDLIELSEGQVEIIEHLFMGFTLVLDYLSTLFKADQKVIRG